MAFVLVIAKRITAFINGFRLQSLFLFLLTFSIAIAQNDLELYIVAALLFLLKVVMIPWFLKKIVNKIKVNESLGLFINPLLSLVAAIILTYLAYLFTGNVMLMQGNLQSYSFAVSLAVILIGIFLMIFRMKALTQIIGLLVIENGLFLAASVVPKGMPFFVEIAIFFDIFICVIILGVFVYKINRLFTHIDVSKLTDLKG